MVDQWSLVNSHTMTLVVGYDDMFTVMAILAKCIVI